MDQVNTVKPQDSKLVKVFIGFEVAIIIGLLIIKMFSNPDYIASAPNYQYAAGFFLIPFSIFAFVASVAMIVATFYFMAKQRFSGIYLWFYGLEVTIWAYLAVLMILSM